MMYFGAGVVVGVIFAIPLRALWDKAVTYYKSKQLPPLDPKGPA